jgi:hypothetical protein
VSAANALVPHGEVIVIFSGSKKNNNEQTRGTAVPINKMIVAQINRIAIRKLRQEALRRIPAPHL